MAINLAPQNEFSGAVALTCAPSSSQVTCSLNPATVTVNGPATATLTITVAAPAVVLPAHSRPYRDPGSRLGWLGVSGGFTFASVLVGGLRNRKQKLAMLFRLVLFAALFFAAGSGSGSHNIQPLPPPPNVTTYSVVVSATAANGIVHNAKIAVAVP